MAIKKRIETSFIMFDVIYEDGTLSSRRRIPSTAVAGLDGDDAAKAIIEDQDRTISLASGRPRPAIKSIARSPR